MIQDDRPVCKESRVVLRRPENTTRVILAKTDSYSPERLQYIIDAKINTSKSRRFYHRSCLLIKALGLT